MRSYMIVMHVKDPSDNHTVASVEAAVQQAIADHARGLVMVKTQARYVSPQEAGEGKNG